MKIITKQRLFWKRSLMVMLTFLLILSNMVAGIGEPLVVHAEDTGDTVYVSDEGKDDFGDGSESNPYATIGKALEGITTEGTIVLLSNLTVSEQITIAAAGKTVTIRSEDGEKYSIIRDGNMATNKRTIQVTGGTVLFENLIIDGNNTTIGNAINAIYGNGGTTTFKNVEIKKHEVLGTNGGSVVMAYSSGKVIISEGTHIHSNVITGRTEGNPPSILGAGSGGTLIIEGGLITDNTVEGEDNSSNGVIVGLGSASSPSFTMTGGEIKDNHLLGNGENTDGKTVGNVAVFMRGTAAQAKFKFSGTAYVYDNKSNEQQRNVFLNNTAALNTAYLSLIGPMTSGAKVGVFANVMPTADAPIVDVAIGDGYTAQASDATYFHSDIATSAKTRFNSAGNKVVLSPLTPELESVWLDRTEVDGKDITLTFNDNIKLIDLSGFTVTVGGEQVTPESYEVIDGNKLVITLPDVPDGNIKLGYKKDEGNLIGTEGDEDDPLMKVNDFDFTYEFSFATNFEITEPGTEPVTEKRPEISGEVTADSTVDVVIKDENGNVVASSVADVNGDTWSFTPGVDLTNGTYTVEVTATSADGKTSVTKIKEIEVDMPIQVPYIKEGAVSAINPADITYNDTDGKFIVPKNVNSFTFKDGDKEMTATKNPDGTWSFVGTVNVPYASSTVTDILPTGITHNGSTDFTVPDNVTEFTFKDGNKNITAKKDVTSGDWTFVEEVLHVTSGTVEITEPTDGVTYKNGKFIIDPDKNVNQFTFKDGDKEMQAIRGSDDEWKFKELVKPNPALGNTPTAISDGVTYNNDGKFIVPSGVNSFTFKDGNKTMKAIKDSDGKWTFTASGGNTGGGGGSTDGGTTPTPTPSETTENIDVNLEIDGDNPIERTSVTIKRTKKADGSVHDEVQLTKDKADEAIEKAKEINNNIARIIIPDVNDEVDTTTVSIPKESVQALRENGLSLEIATNGAIISLDNKHMAGIDEDFYFYVVPVKKENERQAIEERARVELVVREAMQSDDIKVVARPMTIETNLSSRPVTITLPLNGVTLPTDATERDAYLQQLGIFIEHTDGEKLVVFPKIVVLKNGKYGLQFTIEKFSTFTIIHFGTDQDGEQTEGYHAPYIKGFTKDRFGPEEDVTRIQMARMIARILGYSGEEHATYAPFNDIPKDHSGSGAIAFMKEQGIFTGDHDGNFRPWDSVSRAHMAVIAANYKKLDVKENVSISFSDTKQHWARFAIEANHEANIIRGYADGTFRPDVNLSRQHAVLILNRMFERGPLYGVDRVSFRDIPSNYVHFNHIAEATIGHEYVIDKDGKEQFVK